MRISAYLSEKIKILSFFLTVLIVVLHSNMSMLSTGVVSFFQLVITTEVTRIAVPLFYLISGFLFFVNYENTWADYKRKLSSRTRSLLVPYILFFLCGSLAMFVLGHVYTIEALWKIIKHGLMAYPPVFYPLWFLRDLYIIVLLSPIIYWMIRKIPWSIIYFFVIWVLGKEFCVGIPSSESMFFFVMGAFLTIKVKWLEQTEHRGAWGYVYLWLLLCFLNRYISEFVIRLPYATHGVILLLGIYAIWILYDKLYPIFNESLKTANIYKFSFLIYLLHEPILTIIKKTGLFFLGCSSFSVGIIYILAPLMTVYIVYVIGRCLYSYSPKFLSLLTGGRVKN